jgi:uncharacterized protein with LGFP repeats
VEHANPGRHGGAVKVAPTLSSASESVLRGISRALGGATWSRRSFLVRTSLLGSAIAMEPRRFVLEPHSAFEAVCGPDSSCDGGFTAFCCTIDNGANLCPEGTFVGGWWKADRSAFCRGAARYYVDCNGDAGWPWHCHCPDTAGCDRRHVACVQFRYGNCHLEIPERAYGSPVVCRVVTCTPPWVWDESCTTTSFTDQFTAAQSAPCLPEPWPAEVIMKWSDLGGRGGVLGPQTSQVERLAFGNGTWATFRHGAIFALAWGGVRVVEDPIWSAVRHRTGSTASSIGYPLQERVELVQGDGWAQAFGHRRGSGVDELALAVGTRELGTHVVTQPVLSKWRSLDAQGGVLGYPTDDVGTTPDGSSTFCSFAKLAHRRVVYRGAIYANPVVGAHWLRDKIYERYLELRATAGPLGYPSSDERDAGAPGATFNEFAVVQPGSGVVSRGAIYATRQFGAWAVSAPFYAPWLASGAERGPLGFPVAAPGTTPDQQARFQVFSPLSNRTILTGGGIVDSAGYGAFTLLGSIFAVWIADEDGPRVLGVPVADAVDQVVAGTALRSQQFSTGTIFDSQAGRGCVLYGPILTTYEQRGGPTGSLGLPTSSVVVESGGDEQATFQFGTLTYVPGQEVSG